MNLMCFGKCFVLRLVLFGLLCFCCCFRYIGETKEKDERKKRKGKKKKREEEVERKEEVCVFELS